MLNEPFEVSNGRLVKGRGENRDVFWPLLYFNSREPNDLANRTANKRASLAQFHRRSLRDRLLESANQPTRSSIGVSPGPSATKSTETERMESTYPRARVALVL